MRAGHIIAVRVPAATKAKLRGLANRQQLSESQLVRRVLDLTLMAANEPVAARVEPLPKVESAARFYVRLRPDDWQLLRERAMAREMAGATYVSALVRAHLRSLAPIPKNELLALKRTIAELAAVGRNLNQLAKAANQGHRVGSAPNDFGAMLKICEGLRDHVKALLKANIVSWEVGHAESRT